VGLSVGDSVEDEVPHTQAGGDTFVGPTNDESVEQDHSDDDDDDDDSDYCPSEDAGEDSDDEENKRCDPDIEAWVQEKLNMNDPHNERKVRSLLKQSHWMHSATASFATCAPGLKLKLRCCAPHLQHDNVVYVCLACGSTKCVTDGWTHAPRTRLCLDAIYCCCCNVI
jgi:hypothetical protein